MDEQFRSEHLEDGPLKSLDLLEIAAIAIESMAEGEAEGPLTLIGSYGLRIVGTVQEGALAHVVYKITTEKQGVPVEEVMVQTCKRHGDGWLALDGQDLPTMVTLILESLPELEAAGDGTSSEPPSE